jgi:putative selenium metabolism protein SsnA
VNKNGLLIENGIIVTLGDKSEVLENGYVFIKGGKIGKVGAGESGLDAADRIDAEGKVVLPGFICSHHHLYSSFARGMAIPGKPAKNFVDILKKLWWRLDDLLDAQDIYYSSLIALAECIKNGTTSIIDHHESQSYQTGSLDEIQKAVEEAGIRAVLCLGVSDRYGRGDKGLEENERFLKKISSIPSPLVAGMVGLHASFTVKNETVKKAVETAKRCGCGIHVHCAEDAADQKDSKTKHGMRVVERFNKLGALGPKTILVHCVHVDGKEMRLVADTKTNVAHNPESNMNNAIGAADVLSMMAHGITVGLGTDGMSSDMLAQMRCAYLLQRHLHGDPRVAFVEAPRMLLDNNRKVLSNVTSGRWNAGEIAEGAPADIAVIDYRPPTPFNKNNFLGHLIFGMVDAAVDTTIVNGRVLMRNKTLLTINEKELTSKTREIAAKFWEKFSK